jgi:2'-5' RNA ligase
VEPHLTLVFPFASDRSPEELLAHMRHAVQGIAPFEVTLHGPIPSGDEYLFLAVQRGHDGLVALHDRLYTGILRKFLNPDIPYRPHLTVGRFSYPGRLEQALRGVGSFVDAFTTIVDRVSLETIEDDGCSRIEGTIRL